MRGQSEHGSYLVIFLRHNVISLVKSDSLATEYVFSFLNFKKKNNVLSLSKSILATKSFEFFPTSVGISSFFVQS